MRSSIRSTISGSPTVKVAWSRKQHRSQKRNHSARPAASNNSKDSRRRSSNLHSSSNLHCSNPHSSKDSRRRNSAGHRRAISSLAGERVPQCFGTGQRAVERQRGEIGLADQRRLQLFVILPAWNFGGAESPQVVGDELRIEQREAANA